MQCRINEMLFEAACYKSNAASAEYDAALENARHFMLLRPRIFIDGNQWCVLYGEDIQCGVAGFGDTPDAAARQFDSAWMTATPNEKVEEPGAAVCARSPRTAGYAALED